MTAEQFLIAMAVRDYECDMQGIVNNAVYQHYLEHARHEFLKTKGLGFAELTRQGIIVVVVRAEVDYLSPLRSGDKFDVSVRVERVSKIRLGFEQSIVNPTTGVQHLQARITATAVNERGRPWFPDELLKLLD
jgi:acyl-CoA thioester hydrolase